MALSTLAFLLLRFEDRENIKLIHIETIKLVKQMPIIPLTWLNEELTYRDRLLV